MRAIASRMRRPAVSKAANSSRKVSLKASTSLGQTLGGMELAIAVALRQVAADVPEFLEVVGGRALGRLDPERGVAARPAAAGEW